MKINFKKFYKSYIISASVSLVIGLAIFLIYFFVNDQVIYTAVNAASISAIVLICVGGLVYVSNEGFFDFFSFGVKQVGSSIFGKKGNENNDFAVYKEQSRTKRENRPKLYLSMLAVGVLFLIAMIVLRIVAFSY